ncbi:MAG: glycerol kinase GlpK [Methanomassiliicoccales archaeon]|nr:glycerol kinase GlpK [Methanomassiliicoccales archaeon]
MMPAYVGAIDQGTTGTRFAVFDHSGNMVSSAYEEHTQIFPKAGWVEHNPIEIWQKTKKVIRDALENASIDPKDLAGIGITNQRETTVLWDKRTGNPIYNAIVWQCRRTSGMCQELTEEGFSDMFRHRTGLVLDSYFSGTKIKWMLENVKGAKEKAGRGDLLFGNIDTWLIWKLTGKHITDCTNASRTLLFNIFKCEWDDDLMETLGIPESVLPEVRPSVDPDTYGTTKPSEFMGSRVPVCGDLGDQQAALFGQTCFDPGEAKNTYGTGCFMLINTGTDRVLSNRGLLTTIAYKIGNDAPRYALEGSIFITGAAVQWLRDGLKIIETAAETEKMASCVQDSDGVYFVPAFVGLGAPYWDPYARGMIIGITRGTKKEHIVRATLESICYQTRDVIETMNADSGIPLKILRVDGGAVKNNFLCQLQSDVLQVQVVRPTVQETTALGAAYAAGLAVKFWRDMDELRSNWVIDRTFEPTMASERSESLYRKWKRAVERARDWVPHEDR